MPDAYRVEKLIRDLIPDIIRADGREPLVRQVDDEEIRPFVALKVIEEAFEVFEAFAGADPNQIRAELADLQEVVDRLMALAGISPEQVRQEQQRRAERRGRFEQNYLLADPPNQRQRLFPAADRPLLTAIEEHLALCQKAHFAVSFVMKSGVYQLRTALEAALARGAEIRLLTSDYLDVTDPEALGLLLDLPGKLALKAYREPARSYHPKAYIFEHPNGQGFAFIGSSNLSASALSYGVEWNYEVHSLDEGWPLAELVARYDELFDSPHSEVVDRAFVENYKARRRPRTFMEAEVEELVASRPTPRPAQVEALTQLAQLRAQGERRGMVIAATGIGKTYLAAFDSLPFERVLFIAHRDELLTQAQASFQQIRPEARMGFYRGGEHDVDADILFASVSTLGRQEHLSRFAPDRFDYIVVDEFHHAAANSYLAILHYFSPRFLLGLTATPYRGDNRDVFAICDGNVAYKITFMEAIAFGWLCPFHYHGVYDETDYTSVTWRNGRYDTQELSRTLENEKRAAAILKSYQQHGSTASIGFCISIEHARFMAKYFTDHGVPALAVHSGPESVDRAIAISRLRHGDVKVLFTVDLFNEGVDIPEIDLVMFLRPTESVTIFLQQLGRGLRLSPGKDFLTVLDFIGNYKKAHYKVAAIAGRLEQDLDAAMLKKTVQEFESGELLATLPPGVEIQFELKVINLLKEMAQEREPRRLRLEEAFHEVIAAIGHRPNLLELHRWGRFDVRAYRQEFGSWHRFLRAVDMVEPIEEQLESSVGPFLLELEKTAMTKSYKMVVLLGLLDAGGMGQPVHIQSLVDGFRAFFLQSRRHSQDLIGTDVEAIADVSDAKLRAYLERNPIAAWTNTGTKGQKMSYFNYEAASGIFRYIGPSAGNVAEFNRAVQDRAEYRLAEYFEIRYERKNVFNVINSGENKGIIMLGNDETAQVPRDKGWKPVIINNKKMYAKFAKVAINVLKDSPDDSITTPNRLTHELEVMFGPGGYLPQRANRVRITPVPNVMDTWSIEPIRPTLTMRVARTPEANDPESESPVST